MNTYNLSFFGRMIFYVSTTYMGMRIDLGGFAVCSPACVSHTAASLHGLSAVSLVGQIGQTPLGLDNGDRSVSVPYRKTSGVISSVFKLCQPLKQDRSGLFFSAIS